MIENNNVNIEFPIIDMRPYQEEIWDRFINNDVYLTILICLLVSMNISLKKIKVYYKYVINLTRKFMITI